MTVITVVFSLSANRNIQFGERLTGYRL